jgi:class 3 adenylate cyclase
VVGARLVDVPFVGRVDELTRLHRVLGEVVTGAPRLVLLSGDAGVGKSRLVHELVARAREGGALTLLGTCYEDLAIPFLPVATALRPVDGRLERWPDAAGEGGLQLYLDVTRTLLDAAAQRPVVLTIEDVHWADEASADLLVHLVTSALHDAADRRLGLLLVLTRRHPWGLATGDDLLDRLPRSPGAVVVPVRPFGAPEVHAVLTALGGAQPDAGLVEAVLDVTGGNALLVRSMVTRLLDSGRLSAAGGGLRLTGDGRLTPVDIDEETLLRVGKCPRSIPLLTAMAFLGDEGSLSAARALADGDLDEAVDEGLVQLDGDRFRFEHPAVRHVLYHLPAPDERAAMHLRVADLLTDAAAVAHHLRLAGDHADAARARDAALAAAHQAWGAGAWLTAARAYEEVLGRSPDAADDVRGEWLLRAAVASYRAQDDGSVDRLQAAASFARARGDVHRWAEASLLLARYTSTEELGRPFDSAELDELLGAVEGIPSLRARTLATLAEAHLMGRDHELGRRLLAQAEAIVAAGDADASALARVGMSTGLHELSAFELADAQRSFGRAIDAADPLHEPLIASAARARLALAQLATGDVARAARSLEEPLRENFRIGFWRDQQLVSGALAAIAVLEGRSADCERLAGEALSLYRMQEYAYTPGLVYPVLIGCRSLRGDHAGAVDAVESWADTGGRGTWRYRLLVDAWQGDLDAVREAVADRPWRAAPTVDLFTLDGPCVQLEVASLVGDASLLDVAEERVEQAHDRGVVLALAWPWLLSRLLGDARLVAGDLDGAARRFALAAREATRAGASLELGRARLGEARVAMARDDRAAAAARAREAAVVLDGIGALAFAHRARELCAAAGGDVDTPRPGLRAILVTDLSGSTALNVRAGDRHYVELLGDHDRVIRARLQHHAGMEFKHTGDGICAWFATASDALECALGIRDDLERSNAFHPELPLVARIGVAAGEPVHVGDDLFGLAVVAASRVCALAGGGQVYLSGEVARLVQGKGFVLEPVDSFELRGLPGTTEVLEAIASARS